MASEFLNHEIKLYIPLEYLSTDKSTSISDIPNHVIEDINGFCNKLAREYGGVTIYDAKGKYCNKRLNYVFTIKTQIIEIYVNVDNYHNVINDINDFAYYIKHVLKQESIALSINGTMRFI